MRSRSSHSIASWESQTSLYLRWAGSIAYRHCFLLARVRKIYHCSRKNRLSQDGTRRTRLPFLTLLLTADVAKMIGAKPKEDDGQDFFEGANPRLTPYGTCCQVKVRLLFSFIASRLTSIRN